MSPNKYKGAALQPFFMFFLIKDPYQIKSAFLMEECIIHSIKKKKHKSIATRCFFQAVKEDVINHFFFFFAHISSIQHLQSPPF